MPDRDELDVPTRNVRNHLTHIFGFDIEDRSDRSLGLAEENRRVLEEGRRALARADLRSREGNKVVIQWVGTAIASLVSIAFTWFFTHAGK